MSTELRTLQKENAELKEDLRNTIQLRRRDQMRLVALARVFELPKGFDFVTLLKSARRAVGIGVRKRTAWTVVGLFPDTEWYDGDMRDACWIAHVWVDDPKDAWRRGALRAACWRAKDRYDSTEEHTDFREEALRLADNSVCLGMFKGHHKDVYGLYHTE